MKEVEGHFGTAIVSYFIFLRFLFVMNLLIFALWFGFVVVPGIVYIEVNDSPNVASQLACAYEPSNISRLLCPSDNISFVGTNETLKEGVFVYQVAVAGRYTCNVSDFGEDVGVFSVQSCSFGDTLSVETSLGMFEYEVAESEGGETIQVADVMLDSEVGREWGRGMHVMTLHFFLF
jgi:hypothetical protein